MEKERIKSNIFHMLSLVSIPIINVFYALLNNANRGVYTIITEVDRNIPFVKEFIVPYIIWYPFIFLTLFYLCTKDLKIYYRTLISLNLGLIICYITYFLFQTTVPRPILYGDDLFTKLTRIIYYFDKPFNCFPSIHVLTCYLMIKGISFEENLFIKFSVYIVSTIIIISTLFVKQHVVLDLVSAILVGEFVFYLVGRLNFKRNFISDTQ
ncbi:phosphatase PAP2 family protein [Clostridium sp. MSJ-11]|uniref:Phosphatase PAP2 family protein n=1 Tax=Clostridium mobile TaxID=2841512 RepID=A0ABS6EEB0_9CLOT|nr:phosphatase PAP2 family protein [Clostridium mobile]MBU5483544.1 phosphatase PAP2 family protein [Clostridium mobile]